MIMPHFEKEKARPCKATTTDHGVPREPLVPWTSHAFRVGHRAVDICDLHKIRGSVWRALQKGKAGLQEDRVPSLFAQMYPVILGIRAMSCHRLGYVSSYLHLHNTFDVFLQLLPSGAIGSAQTSFQSV